MSAKQGFGTILYCIARGAGLAKGPPLESEGIGGTGVRFFTYRDLVAVVGDAREEKLQASRRNVKAHEEVIEEVMERADVLPLRFGEIAPDEGEIRRLLLEPEYDALVQALDRLHGCIELAIRVSFEEAKLFDEIRELHPDLAQAGQAAASMEGRIELGQRIAQVIESKRERESERVLKALRPLAVDVVENELTNDMMILRASFLVERERLDEFDERVHALGTESSGRLSFKYVGPLPPYSFVGVRIQGVVGEEAPHAP